MHKDKKRDSFGIAVLAVIGMAAVVVVLQIVNWVLDWTMP